jgi:tetratricopeptide (TPR) repeat protein
MARPIDWGKLLPVPTRSSFCLYIIGAIVSHPPFGRLHKHLNAERSIELGNQHYRTGKYALALTAYNRAIDFDPDYAKAHNYRGSFRYAQLGDIQGALTDFDRAIDLDPDYAVAYANRGLLKYERLGDITGALADLNLSIALEPCRDASVYTTRGLIKYAVLGDIEYARSDYDTAISLDPTFAPAYNCRGQETVRRYLDKP